MGPIYLAPKHSGWFRASATTAAVALAVFIGWSWWRPWSPGRLGGLLFGGAAAVMFCLDALYPLRRRLLAWPLQNAQQWLQFHIYGGVIACLFVVIHMGFRFPFGQFGWWLFGLTMWSTASGLMGVYLQKYLPRVLTHDLSVEAIYERIPELTARLQREADLLVVDAPDVLRSFYLSHVRSQLDGLTPAWSYVIGFRPEIDRRGEGFREVAAFLSESDRVRLASLRTILGEKLELDVHYSLQRFLRQWAAAHVMPAILLIGLMAVHIVSVLLF